MYSLDRTQKLFFVTLCLCVISFAGSYFGYCKGGDDIIWNGFMNFPLPAILMVVCFAVGVAFLVISLALYAIQKDLAEHLRYLEKKMNDSCETTQER